MIGLGNPGAKYSGTRHNIGFEWVDRVCQELLPGSKYSEKYESEYISGEILGADVHFLKPLTYMNESGRAWSAFRSRHQGSLRSIVVYDDLDLEIGRIRYRTDGSDGGHRGLRSLLQHSGGKELERIRIGIGRPPAGSDEAADFVLSKFKPEERVVMNQVLAVASEQMRLLIQDQTKAMNQINAWKPEAGVLK